MGQSGETDKGESCLHSTVVPLKSSFLCVRVCLRRFFVSAQWIEELWMCAFTWQHEHPSRFVGMNWGYRRSCVGLQARNIAAKKAHIDFAVPQYILQAFLTCFTVEDLVLCRVLCLILNVVILIFTLLQGYRFLSYTVARQHTAKPPAIQWLLN